MNNISDDPVYIGMGIFYARKSAEFWESKIEGEKSDIGKKSLSILAGVYREKEKMWLDHEKKLKAGRRL